MGKAHHGRSARGPPPDAAGSWREAPPGTRERPCGRLPRHAPDRAARGIALACPTPPMLVRKGMTASSTAPSARWSSKSVLASVLHRLRRPPRAHPHDPALPSAAIVKDELLNIALPMTHEIGFEPAFRRATDPFSSPTTYRCGRGSMLGITTKSIRGRPGLLAAGAIHGDLLHHRAGITAEGCNIHRRHSAWSTHRPRTTAPTDSGGNPPRRTPLCRHPTPHKP